MNNKRQKTFESQTADTLLQRVQSITLGGVEYLVAPPTLATLVLVSEEVSYLPKGALRSESALVDTLREARNYRTLADIVAILILGAKRLTVEEEYTTKVLGFIPRKRKRMVDMKARIAEAMMNIELKELLGAVTILLQMMQTEHFFAIATFLQSVNMTKPTKVAATTASGR